MSTILQEILSKSLPSDVRIRYARLCEALLRDVEYHVGKLTPSAERAIARGWSLPRLRALVVLVGFQRVVMGPIGAAFDTVTRVGLGSVHPIAYGKAFRVGDQESAAVRSATEAFSQMILLHGIQAHWLNFSSVSDLLFALGATDDELSN